MATDSNTNSSDSNSQEQQREKTGEAPPAFDFKESRAFLQFLHPQYAPDANHGFVFQTFDDNKERAERIKEDGGPSYARTLTGATFDELGGFNREGAAIHVTINRSSSGRRKAKDIDRVRKHFVEIDGTKTLDQILVMELKPAWVNESSPDKYHVYFNVGDDVACDLGGFKLRQQKLAALYSAGKESCDLSRVLRLPGFYHQKNRDRPFMVRMVYSDSDAPPYAKADFENALKHVVLPGSRKGGRHTSSGDRIADLPDDVQNFPTSQKSIEEAVRYLENEAPISIANTENPRFKGYKGNQVAYAVACEVRELTINANVCLRLMKEHWNGRCLGDQTTGKPIPLDAQGSPAPDAPKWPWSDDELEGVICHAYRYAQNELDDRLKLVVNAGCLNEAVAECQKMLGAEIARPDPVFKRGGTLVRLTRNLVGPDVPGSKYKYEESALLINRVSPAWLMARLERSISFYGNSAGAKPKEVRKDVSMPLVTRLMADMTNLSAMRTLHATVEAPTLRDDGTILSKPGFDETSGLYFDPGSIKFDEIPESPTEDQGRAAMRLLADLLADFPFDDEVSRAVALAAILTGVVRRTLPTAPAFAFDADDAEAGKTTLAKVVGALVTGRDIGVHPLADKEEERRKAFGTYLEAGSPVLLFDNVTGSIGDPTLDAILTARTFTDRRLGGHSTIEVPTNGLFIFTGNKIEVIGDTCSRILMCRLVPDKPLADRKFKHPYLISHVIENRPALVAAALTALRAFKVRGQPKKNQRETFRFPEWATLIADALIWYDFKDARRGGDAIRQADPTKDAMRRVVHPWQDKFGAQRVTAIELCDDREIANAICEALDIRCNDLNTKKACAYLKNMVNVELGLEVMVKKKEDSGHRSPPLWWLHFSRKLEPWE